MMYLLHLSIVLEIGNINLSCSSFRRNNTNKTQNNIA